MATNMKEIGNVEKKMEKVYIHIMMKIIMMENG